MGQAHIKQEGSSMGAGKKRGTSEALQEAALV